MATLDSAPLAGSRAGRYLFMRQQTSSYVGSLWEVRCEGEQQLLALARVVKVPSSIDKDTEQNLSQAAWDSMELDDENIVRVADVVFGTGWFAMVHDHYDGDTVRTMQRRVAERKTGVPVPVAVRIVLDTLEALRKVNISVEELGVSWQSPAIDPGSLLVCEDGRTRLLDGFVGGYVPSVPKMARDDETFAYAAPEMFDGSAPPDECCQVFRVAVIAYELLCSKRLFVGSKAVIQRRLSSPIVRADRVTRVGAGASQELASVIEKALALDRSQRYQTLLEFEKAVRDAAGKVGTQEDVIQFCDALVGRESTLARLVMDKPQRLSDAMKSIRPTAGVAKSFATRVMGGSALKPGSGSPVGAKPPAAGGKSAVSNASEFGKTLRLGAAPDAAFSAPARVGGMARADRAAVAPPRATRAAAPARAATVAIAASSTAAARPAAPPVPARPAAARAERAPAQALAKGAEPAVAQRRSVPEPAPRAQAPMTTASAPVTRAIAPMASAAARSPSATDGVEPPPPPRQRFKTLVGLFPEDLGSGGAAAPANVAESDENAPAAASAVVKAASPASHVAPVERLVRDSGWADDGDDGDDDTDRIDLPDERDDDTEKIDLEELRAGDALDEVEVGDDELDEHDDLDDAPTQAYNVSQFAALAREARDKLESGPRLASKPPLANEDPFEPAAAVRSPWQVSSPDPSAADTSVDGGPSNGARQLTEEQYEQESTMPAAQALPVAAHIQSALATAPVDAAQHAASFSPASARPTSTQTVLVAPAADAGPAAAAPAKPERRLLMLTMFFAGTTFALAIVALGLLVRSESAEQTASALAGAPLTQPAQNAATVEPPVPSPAPSAPPAAAAVAPSSADSAAAEAQAADSGAEPGATEATEPSEPTEPPAADANAEQVAAPSAPAAAPAAPAAAPRAVRRAAPRKSKVSSSSYVPSDI